METKDIEEIGILAIKAHKYEDICGDCPYRSEGHNDENFCGLKHKTDCEKYPLVKAIKDHFRRRNRNYYERI